MIDRALDAYEAKLFWTQTQRVLAEREDVADDPAWDQSVRDGLERE